MDDFESELTWLEAMTKDELALHLLGMAGKSEVAHLNSLMDEVRQNRDTIDEFNRYADHHLVSYNETNDDKHLEAIEQYAELAQSLTAYRSMLMLDIKQVRERVRWLREQYKKEMTKEQPKN